MLISESNVLLDCKASCKSSRELGFMFNPLNLCQSSNNASIIAEMEKNKSNNAMNRNGSNAMTSKTVKPCRRSMRDGRRDTSFFNSSSLEIIDKYSFVSDSPFAFGFTDNCLMTLISFNFLLFCRSTFNLETIVSIINIRLLSDTSECKV